MSVHVTDDQLKQAEALVKSLKGADGLARVDLDRFWTDQDKAVADPRAADCPRMPLGMAKMSIECVFTELGIEERWHDLVHTAEYRAEVSRRYNDKAERIVGRRLLYEEATAPVVESPPIKALHDIFEAKNVWEDQSYWLHQAANTPDELAALLDRVEERLENLRAFILPPDWCQVKTRILAEGGKVGFYRGQRGPVTFAMSVYGVENLIFLICDRPHLAARFRDLILKVMLERARILDEESGCSPTEAPRGFGWADDNCAMLNKEMYDFFARPILKGMFDRYAPDPDDARAQHSDSDMAQHLPTLGELGLTSVNFGPNLTVTEIREHLPKAIIRGQLAPFTFSRNEEVNMVAELIRDIEMGRDKRGILFSTAGSINDGSRLTGLRLLMGATQELDY